MFMDLRWLQVTLFGLDDAGRAPLIAL